jgi:ketosteroid isomerase-like protein
MDETTELLGLEARRCDAMIAADIDSLETLLSDRLTWTHSSARQDTKASFLAGLRAGGTRYLAMKRLDERVRVHGDVAVVTGLVEMRASIKGEVKELRNCYTNVWEKADGRWRMVAWQSTAAPR